MSVFCHVGFDCSKACLTWTGVTVTWLVAVLNWGGSLIEEKAVRISPKYCSAVNPVQVPWVDHSCLIKFRSGIMSSILEGSERPGWLPQCSGPPPPASYSGHKPWTTKPKCWPLVHCWLVG